MRQSMVMAITLVLAGCGGAAPAAPSDAAVSGTFALRTVDGAQLPIVLEQYQTMARSLLADTVTLRGGTMNRVVVTRTASGPNDPIAIVSRLTSFGVARPAAGDTIAVTNLDGEWWGGTLTAWVLSGPRLTLTYRTGVRAEFTRVAP